MTGDISNTSSLLSCLEELNIHLLYINDINRRIFGDGARVTLGILGVKETRMMSRQGPG